MCFDDRDAISNNCMALGAGSLRRQQQGHGQQQGGKTGERATDHWATIMTLRTKRAQAAGAMRRLET